MGKVTSKDALDLKDHLMELKQRFFKVFIFLGIFFLIFFLKENEVLMHLLLNTGRHAGLDFVVLSPQEIVVEQMKVSGIFAFVVIFPLIAYQCASFISPAFENRHAFFHIIFFLFVGLCMFSLGAIFSLKIVLPFIFSYMKEQCLKNGIGMNVSLSEYLSFFMTMIVSLGLVFEIPLICTTLAKMKIITVNLMKKIRPYVIIFIFILSAIITPPEIVSQCMVALPMCVLYQLSIILCGLVEKRNQ